MGNLFFLGVCFVVGACFTWNVPGGALPRAPVGGFYGDAAQMPSLVGLAKYSRVTLFIGKFRLMPFGGIGLSNHVL